MQINVSPTQTAAERLRQTNLDELACAYQCARKMLLAEQAPGGYWLGELSSSALATATAVSALSLVSRERFSHLIMPALKWLKDNQNDDGGWGDSPTSPSNLPTALLVQAAFHLANGCSSRGENVSQPIAMNCLRKAENYVRKIGGASAKEQVQSLRGLYGADRTFAVPILVNCALAAERRSASTSRGDFLSWEDIPGLPFELASLPRVWFRGLRLHVVSYALPALIALGQLIHARRPTRNPFLRLIRKGAIGPTLRRLEAIQPESGGFLEAVPLTSFVVMSLAAAGRADHPVARRGIDFIRASARPDGSWPIDTNLATWLTTLSVSALADGGHPPVSNPDATIKWLLDCQYKVVHPYTDSPPGGWAWTPLSGGVPDVDDTSGALLALSRLQAGMPPGREILQPMAAGVRWLLALQNADGGWPTFCRGWGKLPFDRSAPDLSAHAIRAIASWPRSVGWRREQSAIARGFEYLRQVQRTDGAWLPLWFGNQFASSKENPVYGTARVLLAYRDLARRDVQEARQGVAYLLDEQANDGSWGSDRDMPGSIEETAFAVEGLSGWVNEEEVRDAVFRGCYYLAQQIATGEPAQPVPIGLYFARLWYAERLYPIIGSVAALGSVLSRLASGEENCLPTMVAPIHGGTQ